MKIAVVGSGYVGLVAGACFAEAGHRVTMVDRDPQRVADISAGRCPIFEPGLPEILQRVLESGRLSATTSLPQALPEVSAVFVAVGTPPQEDGSVDMRAVDAVVDEIATHASHPFLVVMKSTVPPGTNARATSRIQERTEVALEVVSNPEFLKEGHAVPDFQFPERVIVGTHTPQAVETMRRLYAPFMTRSDRLLSMDPMSAEITKYACNAMLASRVSFMNDIARLAESLGADVESIRKGMGSDARIGPRFLYASLGYGGSCFPKDVAALAWIGRQHLDVPMQIVEATQAVNDHQRQHIIARSLALLRTEEGSQRKVAVWGLAFKANTDDVRASPALDVVRAVRDAGFHCVVHDPEAVPNALELLGTEGITVVDDCYDALDDADLLIICTEWAEYRSPDIDQMVRRMRNPQIMDGRSLYKLDWFQHTPVRYHSVGRVSVGGDPA